jgi:hypothetical protein
MAMARSSTSEAAEDLAAVHCPDGHLNSPQAPACRVCGRAIVDRVIVRVHRPQLGRLCRQDAPDLPVTGSIVVGRQPEWHGHGGPPPLLISLTDPEQNLSRSHLQVSVSEWDVGVTDLGSRNGTVIQLPSGRRQQLEPHQRVIVVPSSVIILADIATLWFEVP